jgi:glycosyltransferase involved in cell wall biosynthesis
MLFNNKIFYNIEKYIYIIFKPKVLFFIDKFLPKNNFTSEYDVVFVIPDGKSWVLKGICEEISKRLPKNYKSKITTLSNPLPKAEIYFFSHFLLFVRVFLFNKCVRKFSKNYIYYTHFESDDKIRFKDLISFFKFSHGLLCMNSIDLNLLSKYIDEKNKLFLNVGAVDTNLFEPINRLENKYIGFSCNFYQRKNPDLIFEIIKSNPHRDFKIIGTGWDKYIKFRELQSLKNLKIIETSYLNYPKEYQSLRLFISVSLIEGGPLPTLEALACNVFPIVTDTGFNSDVIDNGKNGFLVDKNIKVSEISKLINIAWEFENDVYHSVNQFSWDNISRNIYTFLKINA